MALYKHAERLTHTSDAAFDATHSPGVAAPHQAFIAAQPAVMRSQSLAGTSYRRKTIVNTTL